MLKFSYLLAHYQVNKILKLCKELHVFDCQFTGFQFGQSLLVNLTCKQKVMGSIRRQDIHNIIANSVCVFMLCLICVGVSYPQCAHIQKYIHLYVYEYCYDSRGRVQFGVRRPCAISQDFHKPKEQYQIVSRTIKRSRLIKYPKQKIITKQLNFLVNNKAIENCGFIFTRDTYIRILYM